MSDISKTYNETYNKPTNLMPFLLLLIWWQKQKIETSHWRCFVRKGILRIFEKFTGKGLCHLCHGLFFNKIAGLGLWHRCFHVNFENFLGTIFSQNTSPRLLPKKVEISKRSEYYDHGGKLMDYDIFLTKNFWF